MAAPRLTSHSQNALADSSLLASSSDIRPPGSRAERFDLSPASSIGESPANWWVLTMGVAWVSGGERAKAAFVPFRRLCDE